MIVCPTRADDNMTHQRRHKTLPLVGATLLAALLSVPAASAATLFQASVIDGTTGLGSTMGRSYDAAVGGGPNAVLFTSEAGDLVADDGNMGFNFGDVFARTPVFNTDLRSRRDTMMGG